MNTPAGSTQVPVAAVLQKAHVEAVRAALAIQEGNPTEALAPLTEALRLSLEAAERTGMIR